MNNRIKELYGSLVGSSIEFSFKKKLDSSLRIDANIAIARGKIAKDVEYALSVGGKLCVMLLAELTNYYRNESYYMVVRSAIEMRRYRSRVLDYMKLPVQERADRLTELLKTSNIHTDKSRDLKVTTLRYFLSTYPSRVKDYKQFLTREEYLIVS